MTNDNRPAELTDRDKIIMMACRSAANILVGRGVPIEDIANGFVSFGGSIMLELVGSQGTAAVFQSKADGLVESTQ